jgi:hypothetical protein
VFKGPAVPVLAGLGIRVDERYDVADAVAESAASL